MQIRSAAHLSLSRRVATESLVLLENKNNTLPLSAATKRKIAVVGPFADCQSCYFGEHIFKLELSRRCVVNHGVVWQASTRRTSTRARPPPSPAGCMRPGTT